MNKPPFWYFSYALQLAAVFSAYYFSAYWALHISSVHTFAAPIWPPTGIALAALYFGGMRVAPAIALAAFLVNFNLGAPLLAALAIAIGNSLEVIVGVYLLRNFHFQPYFGRLGDSISFIAVALSVPFISAIIGPAALLATGHIMGSDLPETSLTWWIGDVLGALVVAPFILKWFARPIYQLQRNIFQWLENLLFFAALTAVSIFVFWDPIPQLRDIVLPYIVFVPFTWGALRVGPRFLTAGLLVCAAIATIGTVMGTGPFASSSNSFLLLQLFLGTVSIIFLLFVTAVEERKLATQKLREHVVTLQEDVQEISEADRAKNEFIAILSHELRNPLAPVLSSLELMRLRTAAMPQFTETIDAMESQIQRITRLLDDLLDITRISRKTFTLQIQRTRLQDVLQHSVTTVDDTMKKRSHTLLVSLPEEAIWVDADPLRLEQVFVNLLNNAAKYTDQGGTIRLAAEKVQSGVEVHVRDSGRGIPKDMLRAIFEPFKQVHTNENGSAGLGIGLSLAKRFVELHGGVIEATSDGPDKGSEFIVWLPVAKPEAAVVAAEPPARPLELAAPRKARRAVLIVDDHRETAEAIANLLIHAGHDARTALSGADALKILADFRPDIIFLDIGLQGENGYDLARLIRQYLDPTPLLVALTGYGQEEDKEKAHAAGFDRHLTKPVSIADLEKVLTDAP